MNILVVAQYIPMPDRQADMLRLVQLLRIASRHHAISLLATDIAGQQRTYGEGGVAAYVARLEQTGMRVCSDDEAVAATQHVDVVLFEYFRPAYNRMERLRYRFPRAVMVIDTVDINYLRLAAQERAIGRRDGVPSTVAATRDMELRTYANADLVVAVSAEEGEHLRAELPRQNIHVVPLIVDVPPLQAKGPSCGSMLFVGNFRHQANVDAARFMIDEILPIVRRAVPEARLLVVGNGPPTDLVSDSREGVEVLGFVPDLTPYYRMCDIAVAPLTWGAGLKGKIAEAMAHGVPVVTTSVGASGFEFRHGTHAMVADTPEDFAAACVALHADRSLYERLRLQGRAFVEGNFSRDRVTGAVDELFDVTARIAPIRLSRPTRIRLALHIAFHRHFGWRWERKSAHRRLSAE